MLNKIEIILESQNISFMEAFAALVQEESDFVFKHISSTNEYNGAIVQTRKGLLISDNIINQNDFELRSIQLTKKFFDYPSIFLIEKNVDLTFGNNDQLDSYDIFEKPVRIDILFSRIREKVSNFNELAASKITVKNCVFMPKERIFKNAFGVIINLTDKETKILDFLYEADGEVIQKDNLLRQIWGYSDKIATHTLETHIYRLRQKIETDPQKPGIIVTDRQGYYLNQGKKKIN